MFRKKLGMSSLSGIADLKYEFLLKVLLRKAFNKNLYLDYATPSRSMLFEWVDAWMELGVGLTRNRS
jgi:hypothetical protein